MDYIADNMIRYSGYNTARNEKVEHLARQNDHGAETHQIFIKPKEDTSFPVLMYKINYGDRLSWSFYEEDYLTSTYFDETYLSHYVW